MSHDDHYGCVAFVLGCILCNFALSMESNDSRLLGIPKSEFIRVIRNIMTSSSEAARRGEAVGEANSNGYNDQTDNNLGALAVERQKFLNATPRSAAVILAMEKENELRMRRGAEIKRDSFYFLQQTLEKREKENQLIKSGRKLSSPRNSNIYTNTDFRSRADFYNNSDGELGYLGRMQA